MAQYCGPLVLTLLLIWSILLFQNGLNGASSSSNRASRAKSRGKQGRQHDQHTCHLREIDACLDKIQLLAKGPTPSSIITTDQGLDKLCT